MREKNNFKSRSFSRAPPSSFGSGPSRGLLPAGVRGVPFLFRDAALLGVEHVQSRFFGLPCSFSPGCCGRANGFRVCLFSSPSLRYGRGLGHEQKPVLATVPSSQQLRKVSLSVPTTAAGGKYEAVHQ